MQRKNAARPIDRTNPTASSGEDALAAVDQDAASGSERNPAASRIYGAARMSDNSHTIQGDIHNHFYGDKLARCGVHSSRVADTNGASGLYIASKFHGLVPESISSYNAQRETWLRSASRLLATCQWIFETEEYQEWHGDHGPPILIWTGPVGCGKSIAASAVIDRLEADSPEKYVPVISYFVDAARNDFVTTREIMLALIKQMMLIHLDTRGQLSQEAQQKIGTCLWESDDVLTHATLTQITLDLVQQLEACTFVIDAIDAMEEPDIVAFIGFLSKIFEPSDRSSLKCKLMLFCRETLGRGIRLQSVPQACIFKIEATHVRRDICLYVDHEVDTKQTGRSISTDNALIDRVRRVLKENADRMFLWARLQVLTIWDPNHTTCDQDIEDQLRELPEGLDDIYLKCLNRVDNSNEGRTEDIAPKVFKWVACAKEPLTSLQARQAVSLTCRNLPLQRPKVLSNSVTDYCANLVTLNHLTDTVTFPHPSVKDFLCNLSKLPPHLHKYHIALEADDLWLGEICVAYGKILSAARSLVQYRKPKFDSRVPGILQNNFTTLLPFRRRRKLLDLPKTSIEVPIVPKSSQGLVGSEFSLHEYMCKYWLEHNRRIHQSADPAYQSFTETCLRHNTELQPWTKGCSSEVERYQQTVQHAVMTNHGPLIVVVGQHLEPFTTSLRVQVFRRPCPGTDSSFLHVAAALGHLDVIPALRHLCGDTLANLKGQSAAAVAVENFQKAAFEMLFSDGRYPSTRTLVNHTNTTLVQECLLYVCAAYGNSDALDQVLSYADLVEDLHAKAFSGKELSEAFFLACFRGHTSAASLLVSYGVDPNYFLSGPWSAEIRGYISQSAWEDLERYSMFLGSSLNLALKMENLPLMATLLASGANFNVQDDHWDISEIVKCYDGKNVHKRSNAAQFIEILVQHGALVNTARYSEGLPWPEYMLDSINNDVSQAVRIRQWIQYMRLTMQILSRHKTSDSVYNLQNQLPSQSHERLTIDLLRFTPDDVVLQMLGHGWFKEKFLLDPLFFEVILLRGTSRVLEALIDYLGFSEFLMVEALGLTNRCLTLPDLLDYRSCDVDICKEAWQRRDNHQTIRSSRRNKNVPGNVQYILALATFHKEHTLTPATNSYTKLLENLIPEARRTGRYQILQFFYCYRHCQKQCSIDHWKYLDEKCPPLDEQTPYDDMIFGDVEPRPLPLTWQRCMAKTGADAVKARHLYTELVQIGSQANFALNWPVGYFMGRISRGIRLEIKMALYLWNFRLNRSKGKAFSSADVWYIGVKLMSGMRDKAHSRLSSQMRPWDGYVVSV